MAQLQINGKAVEVDVEGFLVDPKEWDRDVAAAVAEGSGLETKPVRPSKGFPASDGRDGKAPLEP